MKYAYWGMGLVSVLQIGLMWYYNLLDVSSCVAGATFGGLLATGVWLSHVESARLLTEQAIAGWQAALKLAKGQVESSRLLTKQAIGEWEAELKARGQVDPECKSEKDVHDAD